MSKSMFSRVALLVVLALLATTFGYRASVRQQSQRVVPPESDLADQIFVRSDEERSTSPPVDASQADRSPASVGPDGLHQELMAMGEPYRDHVFWLTLRDAGFKCDEVRSSLLLGTENGAWHADCGEALIYYIVISEYGSISVDTIPYRDAKPRLTQQAFPLNEPQ